MKGVMTVFFFVGVGSRVRGNDPSSLRYDAAGGVVGECAVLFVVGVGSRVRGNDRLWGDG